MKTKYFLLIVLWFFLFKTNGHSQSGSLVLGNDTTLCEGQSITLNAGEGYDLYLWNTGNTEPTITVDSTGEYWCYVKYTDSTNLVFNGDFNNANIGFYTDYVWGIGGPWGILSEEGTYVTGNIASVYHTNFDDCTDHTTGNGIYMIINGDSVPNENVWCQSVIVEPETDYIFSSWFTSVNPDNPAVLEFWINETVVDVINVSSNTCQWQNSYITWNSEQYNTAELCIVNQNTELGGNDFGIDDISLYKICELTDTINIIIVPNPEVELGNDTSLCIGQTIILDAGPGYETYVWLDGANEQTYSAVSPGLYTVTVIDTYGCQGSDSLNITLDPGPEITLGNDTAICQGGAIELSPGTQFNSYLWNDNSSLPYLYVNSSGYYSVQIVDFLGCTGEDEIYVLFSDPEVNLGNDSILCDGDTLSLHAGQGFNTYLWQDGSTDSIFWVKDGGSYTVEVVDQYGCIDSDEININNLPLPYANLGNDQTFCKGDTILLIAPDGDYTYFWNGTQGDQTYQVFQGGEYVLDVVNLCGEATDEVYIDEKLPQIINLGPDLILNPDESILLEAGDGFQSYIWQDGSFESTYLVNANEANQNNPFYFVETFDGYCKSSDTIKIEVLYIWVPEVITPNSDFYNDVFLPDLTTWNAINKHSIIVYNRWGEKVWESSNFPEGWDGKLNGTFVADGTYFWVLEVYYGPTNVKQVLKGSLTIVGSIN